MSGIPIEVLYSTFEMIDLNDLIIWIIGRRVELRRQWNSDLLCDRENSCEIKILVQFTNSKTIFCVNIEEFSYLWMPSSSKNESVNLNPFFEKRCEYLNIAFIQASIQTKNV